MSDWLEFYNSIFSLFFSSLSALWNLFASHFWVVFPFVVALACCFISLFLKIFFRVVNNG